MLLNEAGEGDVSFGCVTLASCDHIGVCPDVEIGPQSFSHTVIVATEETAGRHLWPLIEPWDRLFQHCMTKCDKCKPKPTESH